MSLLTAECNINWYSWLDKLFPQLWINQKPGCCIERLVMYKVCLGRALTRGSINTKYKFEVGC